MAKVTFNGATKRIQVNTGITQLDVQNDLYSDWKEWVLLSDNAKYLQAFRTFGGDPTSTTQSAPKYFFLTNDWKILIDNENVVVQVNLYTEDGSSPFIVQNNGSVSATNSDAQSIKSDIENVLAYDNTIHLDTIDGHDGATYPIGTGAKPVRTLAEAIAICELYNIHNIHIMNPLTLTQDCTGYAFTGDGLHVLNLNNQPISDSTIDNCIIMGAQNGTRVNYKNCLILTLSNFAGIMQNCYLGMSAPISVQSHESMIVSDCRSGVAGTGSPCFDYANGNIDMSVRAYSGGIRFINSTDSNNTTTVEFVAGKFNMESTNTAGYFAVRGVVDDTNINPNGATVVLNGSVSQSSGGLSVQQVRDAMALDISDGVDKELGSIDNMIERVDINTQQ